MGVRSISCWAVVACLAVCAESAPAAILTWIDVDTGEVSSVHPGVSVSGDGSSVVGTRPSGWVGFRWQADSGVVEFGATGTTVLGVSYNGSVVVGVDAAYPDPDYGAKPQAFRWTSAGGLVYLGWLPGGADSMATGISADGTVIVGSSSSDSSPASAFRWTSAGGMMALPTSGQEAAATAISRDGNVIVGWQGTTTAPQAFRWTESNGTEILGYGVPSGVSSDGSVIVGTFESGDHQTSGFRWTAGAGMQSIGLLGRVGTFYTLAVSGDGSRIIGSYSPDGSGSSALPFIWDPEHGMRDLASVLHDEYALDAPFGAWQFVEATGISEDGNIIAGIVSSPGRSKAFIIDLQALPEPGAIFGIALAGLLLRRRQRR